MGITSRALGLQKEIIKNIGFQWQKIKICLQVARNSLSCLTLNIYLTITYD